MNLLEIPEVEKFLLDECGMPSATWSTLYASFAPDAPNAEEGNAEAYLQCSISNAITFFHGAKYLEIAAVLKLNQLKTATVNVNLMG